MLKTLLTAAVVLFCTAAVAQTTGNYILVIGNDSLFLDLGQAIPYQTQAGEQLNIQLSQPQRLTYSDETISFQYDRAFTVATTSIEAGIEQCMIMNAKGSGFIVQKYATVNPVPFIQFMMNEVTKESVSYGYDKVEEDFMYTLASGQTIEGVTATLTYLGDTEYYTVAAYGEKDQGIVVVTVQLYEDSEDREHIDLLLNTLEIK